MSVSSIQTVISGILSGGNTGSIEFLVQDLPSDLPLLNLRPWEGHVQSTLIITY